MPQLNPAPWFKTLLLSWSILTILTAPKLMNTLPQKEPNTRPSKNIKSWTWPWS